MSRSLRPGLVPLRELSENGLFSRKTAGNRAYSSSEPVTAKLHSKKVNHILLTIYQATAGKFYFYFPIPSHRTYIRRLKIQIDSIIYLFQFRPTALIETLHCVPSNSLKILLHGCQRIFFRLTDA